MKSTFRAIVVFGAIVCAQASAQTEVYTDPDAFQAVLCSAHYIEDFNGIPLGYINEPWDTPGAYGYDYLITTEGTGESGLWGNAVGWPSGPSMSTNFSAPRYIRITFTGAPVHAFGGYFASTDDYGNPIPQHWQISLSNGFTYMHPEGGVAFRGFITTAALSWAEFSAADHPLWCWPVMDHIKIGKPLIIEFGACCVANGECLPNLSKWQCEQISGPQGPGLWQGCESVCGPNPCKTRVCADFAGLEQHPVLKRDLTAAQMAQLKNKIIQQLQNTYPNTSFEFPLVSEPPCWRTITFMQSDPDHTDPNNYPAYGAYVHHPKSEPWKPRVYVGTIVDEADFAKFYKTPAGAWDIQKLANGMGEIAAHEAGHSFGLADQKKNDPDAGNPTVMADSSLVDDSALANNGRSFNPNEVGVLEQGRANLPAEPSKRKKRDALRGGDTAILRSHIHTNVRLGPGPDREAWGSGMYHTNAHLTISQDLPGYWFGYIGASETDEDFFTAIRSLDPGEQRPWLTWFQPDQIWETWFAIAEEGGATWEYPDEMTLAKPVDYYGVSIFQEMTLHWSVLNLTVTLDCSVEWPNAQNGWRIVSGGGAGPGDLDCDGAVTATDISSFVMALADPATYQTTYLDCDIFNADCNSDGSINGLDIEAFIVMLLNGGGPQPLTVPGTANIFGAGHAVPPEPDGGGGGVLPTVYYLPSGANRVITFSGITGTVSCCEGGLYPNGPDGLRDSSTDVASWDGVSGIVHESSKMFLAGVFLDDSEPVDPAPPRLNCTDDSFTMLAPQLAQTFFIGDGLTGTGSGDAQQFAVPDGATRLYLGFADQGWSGLPGYYDDNSGEMTIGSINGL